QIPWSNRARVVTWTVAALVFMAWLTLVWWDAYVGFFGDNAIKVSCGQVAIALPLIVGLPFVCGCVGLARSCERFRARGSSEYRSSAFLATRFSWLVCSASFQSSLRCRFGLGDGSSASWRCQGGVSSGGRTLLTRYCNRLGHPDSGLYRWPYVARAAGAAR